MISLLTVLLSLAVLALCGAEGLRKTASGSDPVKVLVLVESLCPGCEEFIQTMLLEAYTTLGPSVMDLTVIPFGNAHIVDVDKQKVECQHGLGECDGNVYELCAIHHYPKPEQYLPFLECMTHVLKPGYDNSTIHPCAFKGCATKNHMYWPSILECHKTQYFEMLLAASEATPDHDYVPWVMFDGQHVEVSDNFIAQVCDAYAAKGGSYPACPQRDDSPAVTKSESIQVCKHEKTLAKKQDSLKQIA